MNSPAPRIFELKFLVDDRQAAAVIEWTRANLAGDPYASGPAGDQYQVSSLYLDTPRFDIFRRSPGFRRRKFRVRRYGGEPNVWLEMKRKTRGLVCKRRLSIAASELEDRLAALTVEANGRENESASHAPLATASDESGWEGAWFAKAIRKRHLRPVCQVAYRRFARVGSSENGLLRVTVDTEARALATDLWQPPRPGDQAAAITPDKQIVELKFADALPGAFRDLVERLGLVAGGFSKYRAAIAACYDATRLAAAADDSFGLSTNGAEHRADSTSTTPAFPAPRSHDA